MTIDGFSFIIELSLLAILIGIWTWSTLMSYEFYSTGKYNRYRFRYWFGIGALNIFHLVLAFFYKIYKDPGFLEYRWMAFMIIDILLFEIFIPKAPKSRSSELFLRITYYVLLIMAYSVNSSGIAICFVSLILLLLSLSSEYPKISKHFRVTFALHLFMNIAPFLFGYVSGMSLFLGTIYSIHMVLGVKIMYNEEKCLSLIIDKMIQTEKERRNKSYI